MILINNRDYKVDKFLSETRCIMKTEDNVEIIHDVTQMLIYSKWTRE